MRFLLTLLLLTLLPSLSFSQDYTIRGVVYDKTNGEPMPFEKVRLLNMDSSGVSGAITDVDGLFSISKLSPGEYIVKAESFGFISITKVVPSFDNLTSTLA